ncbi:hypothetical protein P0Y35_08930 [Kiritimatiellaeota bacterium B1221]|nr:hypothetical protein [Kiritimatiellaeota bacterium B1221]
MKLSWTRRMWISCICCHGLFFLWGGFTGGLIAGEMDEILKPLKAAFRGLKPFQADYRIEVPGMTGDVRYFHNPRAFYTALYLKKDETPDTPIWVVMEYGGPSLAEGEIRMIMGEKLRFKEMKFSIADAVYHPPALISALQLLSNELLNASDTKKLPSEADAYSPNLLLRLEAHSVQFGFGLQNSEGGPSANWLTASTYDQDEIITLTGERLILDTREGHQVRIRREDGLLEKDVWPDNEKGQPLHITLLSKRNLNRKIGLGDLIADYEQIKYEPISSVQILGPMIASACMQLNASFLEVENFQSMLEADVGKTRKRILEKGRLEVRASAAKFVKEFKKQEVISEAFYGMYQDVQSKMPAHVEPLGFPDFLNIVFEEVKRNPEENTLDHLNQEAEQIDKGYRKILSALPLKKEAPLLRLYDTYGESLLDAWRIELMRATLESIKTYQPKP